MLAGIVISRCLRKDFPTRGATHTPNQLQLQRQTHQNHPLKMRIQRVVAAQVLPVPTPASASSAKVMAVLLQTNRKVMTLVEEEIVDEKDEDDS